MSPAMRMVSAFGSATARSRAPWSRSALCRLSTLEMKPRLSVEAGIKRFRVRRRRRGPRPARRARPRRGGGRAPGCRAPTPAQARRDRSEPPDHVHVELRDDVAERGHVHLVGLGELEHDPGRDADLAHQRHRVLVRQIRHLCRAGTARHEHEPGEWWASSRSSAEHKGRSPMGAYRRQAANRPGTGPCRRLACLPDGWEMGARRMACRTPPPDFADCHAR